MSLGLALAERGWLGDSLIRRGILGLLRQRLAEQARVYESSRAAALSTFERELRQGPIAVHADAANAQHYEVPPEFFRAVLGPRLKYSSGYWPSGKESLAEAEEAMLALTCERAELTDGMDVLDLGCGWGSLTLWIAERFPRCRVLGISNSRPQREYILAQAQERGLGNIAVETHNVAGYSPAQRFDRVVSVEMMEHCWNLGLLLDRIAGWLAPGGKLFTHVFCHRSYAYRFACDGRDDWMARHFFTGGMMPSADLLPLLSDRLSLEASWLINGRHYARTCAAWLEKLDSDRGGALHALQRVFPRRQAAIQLQRWRIFFLACEELFAFDRGEQWQVAHYRFRPAPRESAERQDAKASLIC